MADGNSPPATHGRCPTRLHWPRGMDTQRFVREFWQQQPLLIRQGLPGFRTPLSADELAGLAVEPDTTPRLVLRGDDDRYRLEHGPFDAGRFAELGHADWSLLVTDVEKHLPELADWLAPFRFLPDWRLDDLMISYAPDGASVGAHVDEYDVFLLQASGQRRWEIQTRSLAASATPAHDGAVGAASLNGSRPAGPEELPGDDADDDAQTLQLLPDFTADESWLLKPGDILYLPPGVPHHGIAVGDDCMTWSIGFRAPAQRDIVEDFSAMLVDSLRHQRFADPAFEPLEGAAAAEISSATVLRFAELWADAVRLEPAQLQEFVGRVVTANPARLDAQVADPLPPLTGTSWVRHPFSRFAYLLTGSGDTPEHARLFVDGDVYECPAEVARQLCDPGQPVLPADLLADSDQQTLLESLARRGRIEPLAAHEPDTD